MMVIAGGVILESWMSYFMVYRDFSERKKIQSLNRKKGKLVSPILFTKSQDLLYLGERGAEKERRRSR